MFFILSKLLYFFICPVSWVLSLLIAGLIVKKANLKRRLILSSAIVLVVFTNPFLLEQFAKHWDIPPVPLKKTYSCAIVLGGFTSEDAQGHGFFNGNSDRFIQGLKLLTAGKVTHILISGGNGLLVHDKFEESDWVKTQLQQFKVPDSCILIENRSRNTIENAAFSKTVLLASKLPPPYLLVTSAFHMRRSLGIFKKAGIAVIPYPCNYIAGKGRTSIMSFIPDVEPLYKWNTYIKEVIGSLVNYFK